MAAPLTSSQPDRYAVLRESGRWREAANLLKDGPADPVRLGCRHQALVALGRYPESFAEGERFLDARPAHFDMRVFWSPPHAAGLERVRAARLKSLGVLEGRRRWRPWASYYRAILSPGFAGLAKLESLSELSSGRYLWMHSLIGRHHLLRSHFAEALAHLTKGLEARPFDWRTHAFRGEALLCLGKRPAALAAFGRGAQAAPEGEQAAQAAAWRGEANLWLGRYGEALPDLAAACRQGSLFAYTWRAAAVLKLGKPAQALAHLEEAARVFPKDPEITTWRGEALRELGRNAEAAEVLSAGSPGMWARFNRGLVRAALKDERGFLSDYWGIPAPVRAYLMRKISLSADREPTRKQRREILAAGLAMARGYRREDSYGNSIWMI